MHVLLTKHALEVDTFGSDFVSELGVGETLTLGSAVVTVTTAGPVRVDKTSEFVTGAAVESGTAVGVGFIARANDGEQEPGVYEVGIQVTTSLGRTLVDTWELHVIDHAVV